MKSTYHNIKMVFFMAILLSVTFTACEKYELPEAGSIADNTLPSAAFSTAQTDPDDYRIVTFTNESVSSTDFSWDFGTGDSSTDENPAYTFEAGEGTYTVTLTVSDKNGVSDMITKEVTVIEPEEPDAIVPTVVNGDFTDGQDGWSVSSFTDGTTSPFNSSSDGSFLDYEGNDTGVKTPGAKWTNGTSAGPLASGNSRYAYQAFTVSPNTTYVLELEYAIKNEVDPVEGGDRMVFEILDGHYADGADAVNAPTLSSTVGDVAIGKGNFTLVETQFESNESGEIAIWIWGVTAQDTYVDNVKLYPAE